ncbi:hypothetical protein [Adhaeribacter radiodurans]|uniref:Uncharacterized protein n=1 Tax=Adhaeribacter radiodurans TaxID=2745197 RepID=A0A7L7L6N2_9BACT|nr:hypothetical protein [Adhaeribacter radiodurans]QMU28175.1 hypothetical protein HUW48_09035 [Adhaeribacter radiodurans]
MEPGIGDVVLGYFRQPEIVKEVKKLRSGEKLEAGRNLEGGLYQIDGKCLILFSSRFKERLHCYQNQEYVFASGKVAQVVVWWCQEDNREYRIVLPRLTLLKN